MMRRPVIVSMSILLILVICCHTSFSLRHPPRKNGLQNDCQKTTGGNADGSCCNFPFTYRGNAYNKCISTDHTQPWCITSEDGSKWGNCVVSEKCDRPAPVDGGWGEWVDFGKCTKTCGSGEKISYRRCDNPVPNHGGKMCAGESVQRIACNVKPCPVDGSWGEWVDFGKCTKSCGSGEKISYRRCDNPVPNYGGKMCTGESVQRIACTVKPCPVDGGWSEWVNIVNCTKSCGSGERISYRKCDDPVPKNGGKTCSGESVQRIACNIKPCRDCADYYNDGQRTDGVYLIHPDGRTAVAVYCDMTGGGWTVIHKRYDGSTRFYDKLWTDFKTGFGNTQKEYWLGLDNIHLLTKTAVRSLKIEMKKFNSNTDYVAHYSTFKVGDESSGYELTVDGYSGNAGDILTYNSGHKFTTLDRDNDGRNGENCANTYGGPWWHYKCSLCSLNGRYRTSRSSYSNKCMFWDGVDGRFPLQQATMKLR